MKKKSIKENIFARQIACDNKSIFRTKNASAFLIIETSSRFSACSISFRIFVSLGITADPFAKKMKMLSESEKRIALVYASFFTLVLLHIVAHTKQLKRWTVFQLKFLSCFPIFLKHCWSALHYVFESFVLLQPVERHNANLFTLIVQLYQRGYLDCVSITADNEIFFHSGIALASLLFEKQPQCAGFGFWKNS